MATKAFLWTTLQRLLPLTTLCTNQLRISAPSLQGQVWGAYSLSPLFAGDAGALQTIAVPGRRCGGPLCLANQAAEASRRGNKGEGMVKESFLW